MLAVKSYFDGSEIPGKALTLAAIGADEATWREMEARWEELRKARGNPRFVHMTDLMALPPQGIYKGWSEDDRGYLVGRTDKHVAFRLEPDWRSQEIRKRHPQWELVSSIGQATMEKTPALQMTDMASGVTQIRPYRVG